MALFFNEDFGEKEKEKLHMKKPPKPIPFLFVKKSLEYPLNKNAIRLCVCLLPFKMSLEMCL